MNKINLQSGRSMIEMLGVLAIIGVMGYSKAIFRYKLNKTINQIITAATNVQTVYKGRPYHGELYNGTVVKN